MRIVSNPVHQPCPDRIRHDVASTVDQTVLVAQRVIVEACLPESPATAVRTDGLHLLHQRLQRQRAGQCQQTMKVIRHQHIRQKRKLSALDSSGKRSDHAARCGQVTEYRSTPDRRSRDHIGSACLRMTALAQTVGRGKTYHAKSIGQRKPAETASTLWERRPRRDSSACSGDGAGCRPHRGEAPLPRNQPVPAEPRLWERRPRRDSSACSGDGAGCRPHRGEAPLPETRRPPPSLIVGAAPPPRFRRLLARLRRTTQCAGCLVPVAGR